MAFFNKKEDVIDLQLTQYGKYLISQGKLKPVYYAFFDDDILYDQRYASGSVIEIQKDIEGRIIDDTVRSEAQYLFHSVDQLGELNELQRTNLEEFKEKIQQNPEKHYAAVAPLGNSYLVGDKAPAFDIRLYKGEISSSVTTISGTTQHVYSTQKIPQLNLKDVTFLTSVETDTSLSDVTPELFEDGTFINVTPDYLLLRIEEENVPMTKESFDIEVYFTDQSGNIETPLYFSKKEDVVKNGILLDPVDDSLLVSSTFEADQVEYFFNLGIDNEISSEVSSILDVSTISIPTMDEE